jgi:hypothetical protein
LFFQEKLTFLAAGQRILHTRPTSCACRDPNLARGYTRHLNDQAVASSRCHDVGYFLTKLPKVPTAARASPLPHNSVRESSPALADTWPAKEKQDRQDASLARERGGDRI